MTPPPDRLSTKHWRCTHRLGNAQQFKRVFARSIRLDGGGFTVLARHNGESNARMGLAIAKRCCPRAIDRNRLKRIARESFRANVTALPPIDIVVLCTPRARQLSNDELFAGLGRAWRKISGTTWDAF